MKAIIEICVIIAGSRKARRVKFLGIPIWDMLVIDLTKKERVKSRHEKEHVLRDEKSGC